MAKAVSLLIVFQLASSTGIAGELVRLKSGDFKFQTRSKPAQSFAASATMSIFAVGIPRFLPTLDRVYYIIQFEAPVTPQWKLELAKSGVELGSYLPDDAFIALVKTPEAWAALNKAQHVKVVVPYETKFRISQAFRFLTSAMVKVLVRLTDEKEFEAFLKVAHSRDLNMIIHRVSGKTVFFETALSNIEKIADVEGVEWIEPYQEVKTFDFDTTQEEPQVMDQQQPAGDYSDLTGFESGTKLMDFESAYAMGLTGEGQVVGISDTGLDSGSLDSILDDFKSQIVKGYTLGLFSRSWQDPQGHGTHTSGSIVGSGVSSSGKLRGGAYGAKLIMEGMWSPLLGNISIPPDFDKIFGVLRRDDNVHVHSNSWGSPTDLGAYNNFASMVDDISWKYPDLLIIFAAGNSGEDRNRDGHIDGGSVSSPGTAKNCLTVGASKNLVSIGGYQKKMIEIKGGAEKWGVEPLASSQLSENPSGMAAFSSIGPTQDGRIKPEIVAPGTNIVSTRSQMSGASTLWGIYNDKYVYAGGTSMATPLTAGGATIVRQFLMKSGFPNPSAALVKAVLIHSATDLFPGQFGTGLGQEFETTRPNMNEGFGRVNIGKAIGIDKGKLVDDTMGLATGQTKTYKVNAKKGQTVVVTMTYSDFPAATSSAVTLVNDLDLKITDSAGKVYYPNHLSRPDNVNNTEMVEVIANEGDSYVVSVTGRNVPKGRDATNSQGFALVVTAN